MHFVTLTSCSFILITELKVAFLVVLCVAFTVLDMVGLMYFMGLTIEIVTSLDLLLRYENDLNVF